MAHLILLLVLEALLLLPAAIAWAHPPKLRVNEEGRPKRWQWGVPINHGWDLLHPELWPAAQRLLGKWLTLSMGAMVALNALAMGAVHLGWADGERLGVLMSLLLIFALLPPVIALEAAMARRLGKRKKRLRRRK